MSGTYGTAVAGLVVVGDLRVPEGQVPLAVVVLPVPEAPQTHRQLPEGTPPEPEGHEKHFDET